MNPNGLKITPEEQEQLDWCFSILTDEQIYDCQLESEEIAGVELHQGEAAELLVKLYARMIVRNVTAERNQGGVRRGA
jgi:DNA-binding transcriptional regulator YbjK